MEKAERAAATLAASPFAVSLALMETVAPSRGGMRPGGAGQLDVLEFYCNDEIRMFVGECMLELPDVIIDELRELLVARFDFTGAAPSSRSVYNLVKRHMGYHFKKLSKIPPGQLSEASIERRQRVCKMIELWPPLLVFFLDESGFGHQSKTSRLYGWAKGGARARNLHKAGFRTNTTLIAVLGLRGVVALETHTGGTKADRFLTFFEQMARLLPQGSLLVLDNASIHHTHEREMRDILARRDCVLLFLPPYSPDLSPIEPMFGWLKKEVMREGEDRLKKELPTVIVEVLSRLPLDNIRAWWSRKCGHPLPTP